VARLVAFSGDLEVANDAVVEASPRPSVAGTIFAIHSAGCVGLRFGSPPGELKDRRWFQATASDAGDERERFARAIGRRARIRRRWMADLPMDQARMLEQVM
jgi:hypothetical protein